MTITTDDKGGLVCPELFPPNTVFKARRQRDGSILLRPVGRDDVPVVEPIETPEGFLMLPVKLDRKVIAAAIRADRDEQY